MCKVTAEQNIEKQKMTFKKIRMVNIMDHLTRSSSAQSWACFEYVYNTGLICRLIARLTENLLEVLRTF